MLYEVVTTPRTNVTVILYNISSKLDYVRPTIRLRSNKKVKFQRVLKRIYQLYLKSPMARGIRILETLTSEM